MPGLWFSLHWRNWQVTRKKDNGAQMCSKDWRPEEWSGGACMGWRTQGGLGRSKDPWVGTTLPEEKGPRSHLGKQELESRLSPCLKADLAPILLMNTWHPPHFSFPPINHFHSAINNPCQYQPISVLYHPHSHHSASEGPWTETSCTLIAYFYAMLS